MRHIALLPAILIILSSCARPSAYSAAEITVLTQVDVRRIHENEFQLSTSPGLSANCRRDAIFLEASKIALENDKTHFQIVGGAKTQYESINAKELIEPVSINLCRGVCPGMFSASGVSHILLPKFSPPQNLLFTAPKAAKC